MCKSIKATKGTQSPDEVKHDAQFQAATRYIKECTRWLAYLKQYRPYDTLSIETAAQARCYAYDTQASIKRDIIDTIEAAQDYDTDYNDD